MSTLRGGASQVRLLVKNGVHNVHWAAFDLSIDFSNILSNQSQGNHVDAANQPDWGNDIAPADAVIAAQPHDPEDNHTDKANHCHHDTQGSNHTNGLDTERGDAVKGKGKHLL